AHLRRARSVLRDVPQQVRDDLDRPGGRIHDGTPGSLLGLPVLRRLRARRGELRAHRRGAAHVRLLDRARGLRRHAPAALVEPTGRRGFSRISGQPRRAVRLISTGPSDRRGHRMCVWRYARDRGRDLGHAPEKGSGLAPGLVRRCTTRWSLTAARSVLGAGCPAPATATSVQQPASSYFSQMKRQDALDYHSSPRPGKIAVVPTKPLTNQRDLSLAYSPGVAEPCLEIAKDPEEAYRY